MRLRLPCSIHDDMVFPETGNKNGNLAFIVLQIEFPGPYETATNGYHKKIKRYSQRNK